MVKKLILLVILSFTLLVSSQETVQQGVSIHVVQRGENLFRIALRYGLTTEELATLNSISNPEQIQIGQRLLIPNPDGRVSTGEGDETDAVSMTESTVEEQPSSVLVHTVQTGETLFKIAMMYGSTVSELSGANGISDATQIFVGQQIVIPSLESTVASIALPARVASLELTPQILAEGQTTEIRLTSESQASVTMRVLEQTIVGHTNEQQLEHTLLVGVPVFTEPGTYTAEIEIRFSDQTVETINLPLFLRAGAYGSETINLIEGRDNLLDANVESAEQLLLESATQATTSTRYFNGPMSLPAAAAMTSQFGTRRSYNGGAFDRYHSGTDFAGVPGTPILAPAPGVVVLADRLNVRGNATMIDHGWGIYTGYWHQNEIFVAVGDRVETGQIIGTIGSTGRVTGAHLHWELWVNGIAVDPMQWVSQSFS